jgi:predicted ribonuclease YlaK
MEKNIKILDTNILLDFPQIVTKYEEYFIIPMAVLMEIDGLKLSKSIEVAQKARKAAVYICKNMANIEWDLTQDSSKSVDTILLQITKKHGGVLVTNDVSLKVRAEIEGIPVEGYSWSDDYCGIVYMDVSDYDMPFETYNEILNDLMTKGYYETDDYTFSKNEYLIVPPYNNDASYGDTTIFKFDGIHFNRVIPRGFENRWINNIFPRNDE